MLAHLTTSDVRAEIYAWYGLIGQTGAALGLLSCGWIVQYLQTNSGWDLLTAYRLIFYVYSALGAIKIVLALVQSSAVEIQETQHHQFDSQPAATPIEAQPLLHDEAHTSLIQEDRTLTQRHEPCVGKRLLSKVDRQRVGVITPLCLLFALDSFASGLVPM